MVLNMAKHGMMVIIGLLLCRSAAAQDAGDARGVPAPNIDARADQALQRMSAYLGSAAEFSFHATNMVDHVLDNGQKIQLSDRLECAARRPDKMAVTITGDTRNEAFWYDGKSLTLFDRQAAQHGSIPVPATIEEMLDQLASQYQMVVPLAEIFFKDCYKAVIGNVIKGDYAGLHQVEGVPCHHLAFRQAFVDWQIWIEDGDKPLPRKIVITYRETTGQPQYIALLDKWNLTPKLKEDFSTPQISAASKSVDLKSKLIGRSPTKPPAGVEEQ